MITSFDDYCIHQIPEPVSSPSSSDRNFYDRYWFNGFDTSGGFIFEIGLGLYPNRRVMDAHFSVVVNGVQHSFHASRRAPRDRAETAVGPLSIEILKPLRSLRVRLESNQTGIECDLVFTARSAAMEEPRSFLHDDGRLIMHSCRFTQMGAWSGYFSIAGQRHAVADATTRGARDKSWGVRPVGESEGGAPGRNSSDPGIYWVWSPLDFGDCCTLFNTFENREGHPTQLGACILPVYADPAQIPAEVEPGLREMRTARHTIHWRKGTRHSRGAEIELEEFSGEKHTITIEPILNFQVLGLGYQHPEWGHGLWKGELAMAGESWEMAKVDPLDYRFIHLHQVVRARMGDRVGVGTLETLCFGRHVPSGFTQILDGAS